MLEIAKLFTKNDKFNINTILNDNGDSVLHLAILLDDLEFADSILKNSNTDINMRNYNEKTPLVIAAQKNHISIVDYILNDKRFDADESNFNYAFYCSKGEVLTHFASSKYFDANSYIPTIPLKSLEIDDSLLNKAIQKHDLDMIKNHPSSIF